MISDLESVIKIALIPKFIFSGILIILSFFFDDLLARVFVCVAVLTAIDCAFGYYRAMLQDKHVVSRVMSRYMWKFAGYMLATSAIFIMLQALPEVLHSWLGWLDDTMLAFFAIHETISILEHLNELGLPLPSNMLKNLKKIRDDLDTDNFSRYQKK